MTISPAPALPLPNVQALDAQGRQTLARETYAKESRFQREFGTDARDFVCTEASAELRAEVLRLLALRGIETPGGKLEQLHRHIGADLKKYGFDDGVNKLSSLLYDTDAAFADCYHRFLRDAVARHFPYPFYFQATPTVRIHCPDGENNHHYPRYHTDIGYGHPPEEINVWIPLTEPLAPQYHGFRRTTVAESRTILESFDYDFDAFIARAVTDARFNTKLHDVSPEVTTPFGSFTAFDSRAIHSGEALQVHTRASIDIRIVPVEDFNAMRIEYQGTGRRKMRYVPGHGYHSLASDQL